MSSIMGKKEGLFNPSKFYAFTNILTEDFVSAWGGSPIIIQAGETVKLPEYLADKLTDELVNKIMIGEAKLNEVEYYKKNPNTAPNTYRAPGSLGVPAMRKVWEDQIIAALPDEPPSAQREIERIKIREQLISDLNAVPSSEPVKVPVSAIGQFNQDSLKEFAQLDNPEPNTPPVPTANIVPTAPPLRRGRPPGSKNKSTA